MKKVLIIAYFFPPLGGSGVQRSLKLVKHLQNLGWSPTVLTVGETDYQKDVSLLDEVGENVKIIRLSTLKLDKLYRFISEIAPKRFLRPILHSLFIPDEKIGWSLLSFFTARKLIEKEKIDLVFTTSAPYSAHISGLLIKKFYKVPWVADFRDEWSENPFVIYPAVIKKINKFLEKIVLKNASKIVTVSEPMTKGLEKNLDETQKQKFITITNGFANDSFKAVKKTKSIKSILVFVYTGSFYGQRNGDVFFKALSSLIKKKRIPKKKVKVYMIGDVGDLNLRRFGLNKVVEVKGYLNHKNSINYLAKSDVLLLFINAGAGKASLTGKIFEYIASSKPIFALVPENGEAANLIQQTRTGVVVGITSSSSKIEAELLKVYKQWEKKELKINPDWELIFNYEQQKLTKRLVGVFNQCVVDVKNN